MADHEGQAPRPSKGRHVAKRRTAWLIGVVVVACLLAIAIWTGNGPQPQQPGRAQTPPAPSLSPSPSWRLVKDFDLSTNDGGWTDTGVVASRDSSRSSMRQADFGSGPSGDWLTVTAERAGTNAPIHSVDLLGRGYPIPNYFAVDLVYQLPDVGVGMWPAPLWFRPLETSADPRPEGEIDAMEWFGSRLWETDEATASIHKTPYGPEHRQLSLPLPQVAGEARHREHHIRFEKTPGTMTWWVDGDRVGSMTRDDFDPQAGPGSWDAMFEQARRQWYPRITYQVGPGVDGDQAGQVPAGWRHSEMIIKRLEVYTAKF